MTSRAHRCWWQPRVPMHCAEVTSVRSGAQVGPFGRAPAAVPFAALSRVPVPARGVCGVGRSV